jgi:hypothetical protein
MVLHRSVECTPFFSNYDGDFGSSLGRITSTLPTIQPAELQLIAFAGKPVWVGVKS